MTEKRLPSFNDFSPGIIGNDLRPCLKAIIDSDNIDADVVKKWAALYFNGDENKRSSVNIPATLRSVGLICDSKPYTLTDIGIKVATAKTAAESIFVFCSHLLKEKNGNELLLALKAMASRGERATKRSLQVELTKAGVAGLSNGTTDHTTLKNWFHEAGFILADGTPNDSVVKTVLGISTAETDDFLSLSIAQQIFVKHLRRLHLIEDGPFSSSLILKQCLEEYPDIFDAAQFAKKVRDPLEAGGWLITNKLAAGPQGGKSGFVTGTAKLLSIPPERIIPDFDSAVPNDLREKLRMPPAQIYSDLYSTDTYKGGMALELLALRMTIDLGLDPRHFRLRSEKTAHAEVDLIAEASHLLFSRWTIQCKRYAKTSRVPLSDVAKEVGIAIFSKAHVVVVITTSDFSKSAKDYAREIALSQHLQFLLIPGTVVDSYLKEGREKLLEFVRANARAVMALKRGQPLPDTE